MLELRFFAPPLCVLRRRKQHIANTPCIANLGNDSVTLKLRLSEDRRRMPVKSGVLTALPKWLMLPTPLDDVELLMTAALFVRQFFA